MPFEKQDMGPFLQIRSRDASQHLQPPTFSLPLPIRFSLSLSLSLSLARSALLWANGSCDSAVRRRPPLAPRGGHRQDPRRLHRRRLAERPRHLLRRQRRLRHHGRGLRVRGPVQPGVRGEHGGAEHGAVQRGAELRGVLRDPVRRRPALVQPGEPDRHGDGHQLLPAQPRPPRRRRRVVQPASPPLRPRHAHVPQDRPVPRRHRPRLLPPGAVQEARRDPVHDQRLPLLQPGAGHQRGRRGRRGSGEREGHADRVDGHEPQLGPELAVQRRPRRAGPLVPRRRRRPAHLHLVERRPRRLAVRPDVLRQELPGLSSPPGEGFFESERVSPSPASRFFPKFFPGKLWKRENL